MSRSFVLQTASRALAICIGFAACHKATSPSTSTTTTTTTPPPTVSTGAFTNLVATVHGGSVALTFDPIDGAQDYRVYVAPAASDLINDGTSIRNGIYRCAGGREGQPVPTDGQPQVQSGAVNTIVDGSVQNFSRATADATLGYVYLEADTGRLPVYALGDPGIDADNLCFFQRWNESRVKSYTTSDSDRSTMLAAGWRDDGIAFYAPADGAAGTVQISTATVSGASLYFAAGAEASARSGATAAFSALTAADDGTAPLMRVYYMNGCGRSHDELVAGKARFTKAQTQGYVPIPALTWTGLTGQPSWSSKRSIAAARSRGTFHLRPLRRTPANKGSLTRRI